MNIEIGKEYNLNNVKVTAIQVGMDTFGGWNVLVEFENQERKWVNSHLLRKIVKTFSGLENPVQKVLIDYIAAKDGLSRQYEALVVSRDDDYLGIYSFEADGNLKYRRLIRDNIVSIVGI